MDDVTDDMADDFVTGAASDDAARMTREQVVAGLTAALAAAPAPTVTDEEMAAAIWEEYCHPDSRITNGMVADLARAIAAARARQEQP